MTTLTDSGLPNRTPSVETVKRIFEAFARHDIDGALSMMHPQVRLWVVTAAVTRGGHPYVGHEGIREYFRDVDRLWEALELSPVEFDEVGAAVVVLGEVRARGPAGELRQPAVWTWKFTSGLVIDCRVDSDPAAAREALGLWETTEDLLRDYIVAFNRRDTDAMVALTDPEIVNYPVAIVAARKYLGHQGIRNWIRKLTASGQDYTVEAREVRKLEEGRWAVLGELLIGRERISPFAALVGVGRGLIGEWREYLSEESLLRELGHLPATPAA